MGSKSRPPNWRLARSLVGSSLRRMRNWWKATSKYNPTRSYYQRARRSENSTCHSVSSSDVCEGARLVGRIGSRCGIGKGSMAKIPSDIGSNVSDGSYDSTWILTNQMCTSVGQNIFKRHHAHSTNQNTPNRLCNRICGSLSQNKSIPLICAITMRIKDDNNVLAMALEARYVQCICLIIYAQTSSIMEYEQTSTMKQRRCHEGELKRCISHKVLHWPKSTSSLASSVQNSPDVHPEVGAHLWPFPDALL